MKRTAKTPDEMLEPTTEAVKNEIGLSFQE